jgi:hypothetical protein
MMTTTRRIALATTAGAAAMALIGAGMIVPTQWEPATASASGAASAVAGRGGGNGSGPAWGASTASGAGHRAGVQGRTTTTAATPLTEAQVADLVALVEEEKLAGDVYAALGAELGDSALTRIAASEDRHAAALRTLLLRYGIADPTAGYAEGEFPTAAAQALYDELVAAGSTSLAAAYDVGERIERMDIDDLSAAIAAASGRSDLVRVYTNLRTGSQHHLAAFV